MGRLDRGFKLKAARPAGPRGAAEQGFGFIDLGPIPAGGVLGRQRHEDAGRAAAGRAPGIGVEHQGEQPQGFGIVWNHVGDEPAQP